MTPIDLANKIEWEGGILEVIDYGLGPDDLDDSDSGLKFAWVALCRAYPSVEELRQEVMDRLPDPELEEENYDPEGIIK